MKEFDETGEIPCYIFGDHDTRDHSIKPLIPNAKSANIKGMANVLKSYRETCPSIMMHGPTTMGPIIAEAIRLCQQSRQYHILIIMTDGGISNEEQDALEVIRASNYPLSIIAVGLGDGPFGVLEKFDNKLKKRKFDNFNFFDFTQCEKRFGRMENVEETIAVEML